jgi:branched-chain amino acid transport system permease protein
MGVRAIRSAASNGRGLQLAAAGVVALIYVFLVPLLFSDALYFLRIMAIASVLAVMSLGVWVTFAIGRINIGQAAFGLIGGYTTAILSTRWGLSFWLCLPLGGLVAATIGTILGLGILRLRGVYFAMITLSLTEAVRLAFLNGGWFTGGANGITGIPQPGQVSLFGVVLIPDFGSVNSHVAFYYLAAALLVLTFAVVWRIANSRLGWIFRSLQQDEELAQSIGINVAKYRVIAYAICCFFGGLGGAYFAASQQSIYASFFGVPDSIFFILYCFLGGLAYVGGPIVGAFVLFIGFQLLHEMQEYQQLIYALIMIGIMLWLPNGLLSLRPPSWLPGRPKHPQPARDDTRVPAR